MSAAESGTQRAAALRAKAQRLEEQAARIERGNQGEMRVAAILDELEQRGWVVLHDRRLAPRSPANIDHIAVGPTGVFVLDAKNWSGKVTLDASGLGQNGRRRADAVTGLLKAREAVAATVKVAPTDALLVFVGSASTSGGGSVEVVHGKQLVSRLERGAAALDPGQIVSVARRLDVAFPPRASRGHTRTVARRSAPAVRLVPDRSPKAVRRGPSLGAEIKGVLVRAACGVTFLATMPLWLVPVSDLISHVVIDGIKRGLPATPPAYLTQGQTNDWCQAMTPGLSTELKHPMVASSDGPGSCRYVAKGGTLHVLVATNHPASATFGAVPDTSWNGAHEECGIATWDIRPGANPAVVCIPQASGPVDKLMGHERTIVGLARKALG